jgi:hypothetical protein
MQNIHHEIANLEMNLDIKTDEFQNDLNFALVEIVYEWASSKVLFLNNMLPLFYFFFVAFCRYHVLN